MTIKLLNSEMNTSIFDILDQEYTKVELSF